MRKVRVSLVAAGAFLAVLAAIELGLRWSTAALPPLVVATGRRHPPYLHNPGVATRIKVYGYNRVYRINQLGLRGPEVAARKAPGARRLLAIGDSVMFGQKVDEDQTFAAQIEPLLNSGSLGGAWQALNGAVAGYDAWDYAPYLEMKGFALEPDVVVLGLYMNDHIEVEEAASSIPGAPRPRLGARLRAALLKSATAQEAVHVLNRFQTAKAPLLSFPKRVPPESRAYIERELAGDPSSMRAFRAFLDAYRYDASVVVPYLTWLLDLGKWRAVEEPLARVQEACRARGVRLLVAIFPVQFEVYRGYEHPEPRRTITAILDRRGIPWVDVRAAFARTGAGDELFEYRYDLHHPGARGYAVAARAVAEKMSRLGWFPEEAATTALFKTVVRNARGRP